MEKHLVKNPPYGYALLLACLISALVVPAHFDHQLTGGVALSIILSLILLAGIYLAVYRVSELIFGAILALPPLLLTWWENLLPFPWSAHLTNGFYVIFLGYISFFIARFMFETDRVSLDMIFASICLYFLIGLMWAFIFHSTVLFDPGAFSFATAIDVDLQDTASYPRNHFAYFSYVTLSTLGYGDITPISRVARSWVILEVLLGQFYLVVVVARLVGLYLTQEK